MGAGAGRSTEEGRVPVHGTEGVEKRTWVSRPAPREGLVGDGLSVAVLDEPPQSFHDARLRVAEVDPDPPVSPGGV